MQFLLDVAQMGGRAPLSSNPFIAGLRYVIHCTGRTGLQTTEKISARLPCAHCVYPLHHVSGKLQTECLYQKCPNYYNFYSNKAL